MIVVVRQLPDSQMEMLEKQLGIQDRWRAQSSLHDHKAVDTNELTNSGTAQREDMRGSHESTARKDLLVDGRQLHEEDVQNWSSEGKSYSKEIWRRRKHQG